MNKSAKVKAVFEELSGVAGGTVASVDLLTLAASMVEVSHVDYISPAANDQEYGTPFDCWSLDSAFADGGWRVMCRQDSFEHLLEDEEAKEMRVHAGLVRFQREYMS
jgi:hypothetical protein